MLWRKVQGNRAWIWTVFFRKQVILRWTILSLKLEDWNKVRAVMGKAASATGTSPERGVFGNVSSLDNALAVCLGSDMIMEWSCLWLDPWQPQSGRVCCGLWKGLWLSEHQDLADSSGWWFQDGPWESGATFPSLGWDSSLIQARNPPWCSHKNNEFIQWIFGECFLFQSLFQVLRIQLGIR